MSLEDDLMRLFGSDRIAKMMDRLGLKEGEVIQHSMITNSIERAQKKVEENNFGIRKRLLEFDDVMNAQREVIYKRRKHALFGERLKLDIDNMLYDLADHTVELFHSAKNFEGYKIELIRNFGIESPVTADEFNLGQAHDIAFRTYEAVLASYQQRVETLASEAFPVIENVYKTNSQGFQNIAIPFSNGMKGIQIAVNLDKAYSSQGKEMINALEKGITLAIIDQNWKEHLRDMDDLRSNVQFAAHEQKDPLLIYKKESFELFRAMITRTNAEIANFLLTCQLPSNNPQVRQAPVQREIPRTQTSKESSTNLNERAAMNQHAGEAVSQQKSAPVIADPKIGRNDPCPCGSGKKYKACHGK